MWLPVRGPCGAYGGLVWSNNPALTHFASIVPLPSEECQRPVFLQSDSDIVAPFILTLQPYLTRQELCNATLEMNRSWALVAEPPGAAGSLKLISQCENTVDYITRQRLTIHHFENSFHVKGGRKLLRWCGVTGGAAVVSGTHRPPPHSWDYSYVAVKSDFTLFCFILKHPRVFKLGSFISCDIYIMFRDYEFALFQRSHTSLSAPKHPSRPQVNGPFVGCAAAPGSASVQRHR